MYFDIVQTFHDFINKNFIDNKDGGGEEINIITLKKILKELLDIYEQVLNSNKKSLSDYKRQRYKIYKKNIEKILKKDIFINSGLCFDEKKEEDFNVYINESKLDTKKEVATYFKGKKIFY